MGRAHRIAAAIAIVQVTALPAMAAEVDINKFDFTTARAATANELIASFDPR